MTLKINKCEPIDTKGNENNKIKFKLNIMTVKM